MCALCAGGILMSDKSQLPRPFKRNIKGVKIFVMAYIGRATKSVVRSGNCSAIDFGISSPITTCIKVISEKARVTARECVANPRQA